MDKRNFENYTAEDFITDESFINYHFHSNKADEIFWKEWIATHPEKIAIVNEAEEMIQALSLTVSDAEYERELSKITAAIHSKKLPGVFSLEGYTQRHSSKVKRKKSFIYISTFLLILITVGYFLSQDYHQKSTPLNSTINTGTNALILTLSDSTVVTLAPHSTLRYPLHFKEKERNVYLEGDAGFSVRRNTKAPFKVYVENMVTTVLGTVFNIKRTDTSLTVDLLKGKLNVAIINQDAAQPQSLLLAPDESAVYVRNGHRFYKRSFLRHTVAFYKNDFKEVAKKIKETFGMTVINRSHTNNWHFTGEFKNATAKEIIESITLVEKCSYEMNGDTVLIK